MPNSHKQSWTVSSIELTTNRDEDGGKVGVAQVGAAVPVTIVV